MRPFFNSRLFALAGLYLALALAYNVATPLFEAPDERDHMAYADWLADGNELPHLVDDRDKVGEIWQPPLYYALVSIFIAPIDRSDLATIAPLSADWRAGLSRLAHYHTAAESFPYRGAALAVHVARGVSAALGLITILAAYGMARRLLPGYALVAAALVALNPQFIFMSAAVNNDNLVIALCSVTLWILVKLIVEAERPLSNRKQVAWFAALGLVWGLAALAKLTGLTLGLVIGLTLLYWAWRKRSWRPLVVGGLVTGGVMLLVGGWFFWRNWQLYGDPLAWNEMLAVTGGLVRPELLPWLETWRYAGFLRLSYWASFGYGILAPAGFYRLITIIMGLIGVGWAVRLVRARQMTLAPTRFALLILAIWSLTVFVFLLRWMRQIDATNQGRLLFPAIAALGVLGATGLAALDGRRLWLGKTVVVALGCWAAAMPLLVIGPAFAQPRPVDAAAIARPVDIEFGDGIRLLGYDLLDAALPGEPIVVSLYWEATRPITESYVVALRILDPAGQPVSSLDVLPAGGRYATPVWQAGWPFRDTYELPPVADEAVRGRGTLLVILYPRGAPGMPLPVNVGGAAAGYEARLGAIKLPPAVPVNAAPAHENGATFDGRFRLLGYDAPESVLPGDLMTVTLHWTADAPDGRDYTVFVHLLDAAGQLVAQSDGQPRAGMYPTSIWSGGEHIVDEHALILPASLPPGDYSIRVGLYDAASGARLPAYDPAGNRYGDDAVDVTVVRILALPTE